MFGKRFGSVVRVVVCVVAALGLVACSACSWGSTASAGKSPSATADESEPITVVASLNQWGSLAAVIGGDNVKVSSILSSTTADAHDFEPTAQDIKKLHGADVVLVNGAGYDSWASKNVSADSTVINVADIVGAMEGDNPHLWFSRDARYAVADQLAETFERIQPAHKKAFGEHLDAWRTREDALETSMHEFSDEHPDLTYAATEDIAYYLMSDLGFSDVTPSGYLQAVQSDGEPAPADLKEFEDLLKDGKTDLFINNPQESNETTNLLLADAKDANIPVLDITEQMPQDCENLTQWIEQLFDAVREKMTNEDSSQVQSSEQASEQSSADSSDSSQE